jgi:hypothetical protein
LPTKSLVPERISLPGKARLAEFVLYYCCCCWEALQWKPEAAWWRGLDGRLVHWEAASWREVLGPEGLVQTRTPVERPEGVHERVSHQQVAGVAVAGNREAAFGVAVADRRGGVAVALAFPWGRLELENEDCENVP